MQLNPADAGFAAHLRSLVPDGVIRLDPEPRYFEEPRGRYAGRPGVLALPTCTDQVSALIKAASVARVPVVPYAGGTGLVGGQIMPDGPPPLLLSVERMQAIRAIYPRENVVVVESGTILADLQRAADQAERLFPLSLASEGSARVGGLLATNAGGTGVLRYGNMRDLCIGLEAVLPDGRVWNGLSRLRKDNTGYDLRNLLVGSEGTLGIITAASLKVFPRPTHQCTAFFVVPSPAAALDLLSLARTQVGEAVSAFELIHGQGFAFLSETLPDIRQPFEEVPQWCVLIELGLSADQNAEQALLNLFERALAEEIVSDGKVAQSLAQSAAFWSVREHLPEANRRIGSVSSHDISVPLGAIPDFIETGWDRISDLGAFRINCFGHVGDGNLHFNVFPPPGRTRADYENERWQIKRCLHDLAHELGGSISAEHGIGRLKVADLQRYGDPVKLDVMRAIKAALDPQGIMNPGVILAVDPDLSPSANPVADPAQP